MEADKEIVLLDEVHEALDHEYCEHAYLGAGGLEA